MVLADPSQPVLPVLVPIPAGGRKFKHGLLLIAAGHQHYSHLDPRSMDHVVC
jgi:hypothetical protein